MTNLREHAGNRVDVDYLAVAVLDDLHELIALLEGVVVVVAGYLGIK
jgi:hypothetical protein